MDADPKKSFARPSIYPEKTQSSGRRVQKNENPNRQKRGLGSDLAKSRIV